MRPRKYINDTKSDRAQRSIKKKIEAWSPDDQKLWRETYPECAYDRQMRHGLNVPSFVTEANTALPVDMFFKYVNENYPSMAAKGLEERLEVLAAFADEITEKTDLPTVREYLQIIVRFASRSGVIINSNFFERLIEAYPARKRGGSRSRPKHSSDELAHVALKRLLRLRQIIEMPRKRSIHPSLLFHYRNCCIVALLSRHPLRLRNVTELELGISLCLMGRNPRISLKADDTKSRKPLAFGLVEELVPHLRYYVDVVRPSLMGNETRSEKRAWIAQDGCSLSPIGVHWVLSNTTHMLVGTSYSAHDFRYALADTAAKKGFPLEVVGQALGHSPAALQTTEGYQSLSDDRPMESHRRTQSLMLRQILSETVPFGTDHQ